MRMNASGGKQKPGKELLFVNQGKNGKKKIDRNTGKIYKINNQ